MRIRDWYFQGWERRERSDGKTDLVYTGEYYALPAGKPAAVLGGLTAAHIAVYLTAALLPSPGGMWHIAAVPQLLELIPLIYLVIGLCCLLRAERPMTFRSWYASWRRMRVSAVWSIVFSALMSAAELAYLFAGEELSLWVELSFLARTLILCGLGVVMYRYFVTHPCQQQIDHSC